MGVLSDVPWADGRERLCAAESSTGLRRVAAWGGGGGVKRIDCIKDGVGFNGVFVINLVISLCFPAYMEIFSCVHKGAFVGCVYYFHDVIDRAYGVVIVQKVDCKAGFPYVVFVVMKMFAISFLKRTVCLADIFFVTVWACEAVHTTLLEL